jgi:hypothetical protein
MNTKIILLSLILVFVLFIFMGLLKSMNIYEGNQNQGDGEDSESTESATVANITTVTKKSLKG